LPAGRPAGKLRFVAALKVGQWVRVQAPGIAIESGSVSQLQPGTLFVLEGGQEWAIPVANIERLEVRHRTVVQNAFLFGLVGTLTGLGAKKFKEDLSATPFAVGGFTFGVLFGLTQWKWSVRFPR
jgi:hypothetical protein